MSLKENALIIIAYSPLWLFIVCSFVICGCSIISYVKDQNEKTKKLSVKQIKNLMIKILNSPYLRKIEFDDKNLILEQRYEDTSIIWTFDHNKVICYTKIIFKNEFSVFIKPTSFSEYKKFKKKLYNNIHTARMNAIFNQTIDYLTGNLDITPELLKLYLTTETEEDINIDDVIGFKIS